MSTEAPRNQGTGEPIPRGLKGFAAKIQQSLTHLSPEQKQYEREEQLRTKEALRVLKELRVEEKLKYIQDTVWQGKGELVPFDKDEARFRVNYPNELTTAGFLLVHYYPACKLVTETHSSEGKGSWTSAKYIPETRATRLCVEVVHHRGISRDPDESSRDKLNIFSGIYSSTYRAGNSEWPMETIVDVDIDPTNTTDLDNALAEETNKRVRGNFLPAQLEQKAKRELDNAMGTHAWEKWVTVAPEHEIYAKTLKTPQVFKDRNTL